MSVKESSGGPAEVPPMHPRRARTRAALIGAAQQFLSERRTAVSIQDITDRAGVGFGSFFNHFESKDDLFEAAVDATVGAYAALLQDLVADIEDPAEVFTASFRLTGRLQRRLPEQVRILLHAGTAILVRDEGLGSLARRDLRNAIEQGRFDLEDDELGLMAVGGALLGLLQMLESHPELDDGDVSDRFAQRVLRALGIPADEAERLCAKPLPDLPAFD